MMTTDFYIKRGDRQPGISAVLRDAAGVGVNLTGATVKFLMRRFTDGALIVSAGATPGNQTTDPGRVNYLWAAGDTDVAGYHYAEWEVTYTDGTKQTFPTSGYHLIDVIADLDSPTLAGALFALVRRLRPLVAEPTMEIYSDSLLAAYLTRNALDPNVTAAEIWREKAAGYAELVDVTEGSSSRKMSQLHGQATTQAKMYSDSASTSSSGKVGYPVTRAITRA